MVFEPRLIIYQNALPFKGLPQSRESREIYGETETSLVVSKLVCRHYPDPTPPLILRLRQPRNSTSLHSFLSFSGNLVFSFVLTRKELRNSFNLLLVALAFFDCCYLIGAQLEVIR